MGEIGAIGDVMTGAAMARAVEPNTRAVAADGHTHEAACLNCATPLVGAHCHACGQRAHVHRTLRGFFHDLLHGVFHFEGKIFNTLPLLAWRPGELTRDYIEGKRASFVSPLALFLFSIFLMFAVVNSLTSPIQINESTSKRSIAEDRHKSDEQVRKLTAERANLVKAGKPTAAIDGRLKEAREEARILASIAERGFVKAGTVRVSEETPEWIGGPLRHAVENPDLLFYKVQNNAYKYSWALIPLSLPFMWLLFPFSRRFRLYDHVVFVTYSLCFMTLLVIVASLFAAVGWTALAGMTMIVPPFHMYRQLKGAYGLKRSGALWRTAFLTLFSIVAMGLFLILLFTLGLF